VSDITLATVCISTPSDFKIYFDSVHKHTVDSVDMHTCFYFKFTFEKEKLVEKGPAVGLLIDLEEPKYHV